MHLLVTPAGDRDVNELRFAERFDTIESAVIYAHSIGGSNFFDIDHQCFIEFPTQQRGGTYSQRKAYSKQIAKEVAAAHAQAFPSPGSTNRPTVAVIGGENLPPVLKSRIQEQLYKHLMDNVAIHEGNEELLDLLDRIRQSSLSRPGKDSPTLFDELNNLENTRPQEDDIKAQFEKAYNKLAERYGWANRSLHENIFESDDNGSIQKKQDLIEEEGDTSFELTTSQVDQMLTNGISPFYKGGVLNIHKDDIDIDWDSLARSFKFDPNRETVGFLIVGTTVNK